MYTKTCLKPKICMNFFFCKDSPLVERNKPIQCLTFLFKCTLKRAQNQKCVWIVFFYDLKPQLTGL